MSSRLRFVYVLLIPVVLASCRTNVAKAKRDAVSAGDRHFERAEYAEAVVEYRRAIQYDSRFGEARFKLARTYIKLHDGPNAYRESLRAADLMPGNADAQLQSGQFLLTAGDFEGAQQRALRVLHKDPRSVEGQILLGNALAGLKDLDGAITQVESAIDKDPQRTMSYTNLGALQLSKGNREAAEASFKRGVASNPKSGAAHLALANFYWAGGRKDDAERELETARELDPKSAIANRALAVFYMNAGRMKDAERYLKAFADSKGDSGAQLTLADFYLMSGRQGEARTILDKVSVQKEAFVSASLRIATMEYTTGQHERAYKTLESISNHEPKNEDARITKLRFLLDERKIEDALTLANSVVADNPASFAGHYLKGLALEATRSSSGGDEAIKEFRQALQLNPTAVSAQVELARLSLARKDTAAAVELAQQAVKAQPHSVSARVLLARAKATAGDLRFADSELTALAKAAPSAAEVHVTLGHVALAEGDYSRARVSYERALHLDPTSLEALDGIVGVDLAQKRPADAKARIDARLAANPSDAPFLLWAGNTFRVIGDAQRSEASFRRAMQIDPNSLEAYSGLGRLFAAQGRLDSARMEFEELARRQPQSVAANTMLGMILDLQNKRREARERYERVLAVDPQAPVAANNLAWAYAEDGTNLDIALQLAQTAKARLPNRHEIDDTLGWVYYRKGLTGLAIASFLQSVAGQPKNAVYLYHLGLAYTQGGDKVKARQMFTRALQLEPNSVQSSEARKALSSL